MITLYLNTATQTTTVALYLDGEVLAKKRWSANFDEAEKLQPAVEKVLDQQKLSVDDVDRLACCIGPGGFTSVRVGVSATNAWAFAKGIPVAAVTVFELYGNPEGDVHEHHLQIVTANANEAWVEITGKDPQFVNRAEFESLALDSFSFTGILHDEWKEFLTDLGGKYVGQEESWPSAEFVDQLAFGKGLLKPWYYKDPNITWSEKNLSPTK